MRRRTLSWGRIVGIVSIVVAPLAIHVAIATSSWPPIIVAVPVLQLVILAVAIVIRHPMRAKWLAAAAGGLILGLIWAQRSGVGLVAVPGIPHALGYFVALVAFASSLLPGRTPILTRIVVAVRGPLSVELIAHTRRMTWAWCFFFAAQLILSGVLFFSAPIETWSFFINVLNFPLVLIMFGAEICYRFIRFHDRDSLADIVGVIAKSTENVPRQAKSA